jgi:N-acetylneuraminate synthase/N,N'-diacetyllegionaminate synthase
MNPIKIGNTCIGEGCPCFIIAEAGVNHNGDLSRAKKMIETARKAGADAVKFQTFRAESLTTRTAKKAQYQCRTTGSDESQFEMLKKLELSPDDFNKLSVFARKVKIEFLSSPFDKESVDLLESLDVAAYKIPSGELTNIPLLKYIAPLGKPVILSTGMADIREIKESVSVLQHAGLEDLILLHCITSYPAPLESLNLRMIETLRDTFNVPTGFSDHSAGITGALLARALGACVIEKHFTLNRNLLGPDHAASLDPAELAGLVAQIRLADLALGNGKKNIGRDESAIKKISRKSLVAGVTIKKGANLTPEMIRIKRPGSGIPPKFFDDVLGRKAKRDIRKDTVIQWEMLT